MFEQLLIQHSTDPLNEVMGALHSETLALPGGTNIPAIPIEATRNPVIGAHEALLRLGITTREYANQMVAGYNIYLDKCRESESLMGEDGCPFSFFRFFNVRVSGVVLRPGSKFRYDGVDANVVELTRNGRTYVSILASEREDFQLLYDCCRDMDHEPNSPEKKPRFFGNVSSFLQGWKDDLSEWCEEYSEHEETHKVQVQSGTWVLKPAFYMFNSRNIRGRKQSHIRKVLKQHVKSILLE